MDKETPVQGDREPGDATGILKKTYRFDDFEVWDDSLARSIKDFYFSFGVHPNIMCAGTEVYTEIDKIVQDCRDVVSNDKGEHPPEGEKFQLGSFRMDDEFDVEFTLNEVTPFPGYLLIFDEEPSFDGEPEVIEDDGVITASYYKVG